MAVDAPARANAIALDWAREQAWLAERRRERAEQQRALIRPMLVERRSDELRRALLEVPAEVWLPALTGVEVPRGRHVCCPLPGHDDGSPSCRIYDTSFYCFGCSAGGDIFNFASELYGIPSNSRDFPALRERLADDLLGVHP
jgi:hypothetical protein